MAFWCQGGGCGAEGGAMDVIAEVGSGVGLAGVRDCFRVGPSSSGSGQNPGFGFFSKIRFIWAP